MKLDKKIIAGAIFFIVLLGGGIVWWQGSKEEERLELPEGIKMEKIFGKEFLVSEKDDYKIFIPQGWRELYKVDYEYLGGVEGVVGTSILSVLTLNNEVSIACFLLPTDSDIDSWLRRVCERNNFPVDIRKQTVGEFEVLSTRLFVMQKDEAARDYFFEAGGKIFKIMGANDQEAKEIIKNSSWPL